MHTGVQFSIIKWQDLSIGRARSVRMMGLAHGVLILVKLSQIPSKALVKSKLPFCGVGITIFSLTKVTNRLHQKVRLLKVVLK